MFFKKITVYLCPVLIFLGLESLFLKINLIYILLLICSLILILSLKVIIKERFFSRDFFWLSLLPLLLLFTTVGFLLLLNSGTLRHLAIVIFVIILGSYLENIFIFFYRPIEYQPYALENLSNLLIILIFFLLALNLNAFSVFLNLRLWQLSLILLALLSALIFQAYWANKFKSNFKLIYLLIINIVMLEAFWCLSFLPTNFYASSIILTILFYLIWGIIKAKLSDKLEKKILQRYLLISFILLVLVALSTPWA
jgi:hypothetical protein